MKAAEKALHTEQRARGVTFRVGDEPERLFPLDLMPRIITADDWVGPHRGARPARARAGGVPARRLRRAADHRGRRRPRRGRRRGARPQPSRQARAGGRGADRRGRHRPGARPARPLAGARGQPAGALRHGLLDHEQAPDPQRDARPGAADRRRRRWRTCRAGCARRCSRPSTRTRPATTRWRCCPPAPSTRRSSSTSCSPTAWACRWSPRATCRSPTTGCSSSARAGAPGSRRSTGASTSRS